jgi:hypothetical protein
MFLDYDVIYHFQTTFALNGVAAKPSDDADEFIPGVLSLIEKVCDQYSSYTTYSGEWCLH